jgi:deoxycytidylate deaminase
MDFGRIVEMSFALAGRHKHAQRCKHFSFIFQKNKLLSIGINSPKTHPLNLKYNYVNKQKDKISHIVGTHSEMSAVIKLGTIEGYDGLTIVNTRINRKKELDYSHPCNGCMEMLLDLKFEKIYFTTKEKKFKLIKLNYEYSH